MKISSSQSAQNVFTSYFAPQKKTNSINSPSRGTSQSDTVSISDEARKAAQCQSGTVQSGDSTEMTYNDLPVEAFSLPSWSNKWIPDLVILDSKIGDKYIDSNAYKYSMLSSTRKQELNEYTNTLRNYINEELNSHGIKDRVDYYTKFMQDDKLSEQVHQAVTKRLADNPHMMDLMQSFDISL